MLHGYIRVSTVEQAGGTSPEDQERRIQAIASLTDAGEPRIWRDVGVSGSVPLGERPAGSEMLDEIARGDVVVSAKLDRLFRNAEDALVQSRHWREEGIDLVLVDMGTDPVTTSAAGRLYFGMLAQFAEFERERINERTRDGRDAKRQRGGFIGGHAPTGYRVVGAGKTSFVLPDESEMELVAASRHLSNILVYDRSPTRIASRLNEMGYRSRAGSRIVATQVWRWVRRAIIFEGPQAVVGGGQVYRCYDGLNRLRYIGSSKDARRRFSSGDYTRDNVDLHHDWYAWVTRVVIENHLSRDAAYVAETTAQRSEIIYKGPRAEATEAQVRIVNMI